jgi:hypothetical protein
MERSPLFEGTMITLPVMCCATEGAAENTGSEIDPMLL